MKGAAWAAALIRSSEDALGSLMMPNKKSSGDIAGFAAAAAIAAFMSAVFLFFAWFRSSWHCCFPKALLGPIEPATRHTPLPGRRGPKPQPEAHRRQCAGRLSRAPGE